MRSILITGAQTALAHKLKNFCKNEQVVLGDYLPLPATASLIQLPDPASNAYIHELLKIALAQGLDQIYPLRRAEALALQHSGSLFAEYGIALALPLDIDLHSVPVYSSEDALSVDFQDNALFWHNGQGKRIFLLID